ncbi:MAG: DUF4910 domain-containing protein [Bacteroidia bacterium]|nr:DUF4910 domain-containing protein [Bacteroidia bacterium]
MEKEIEKYFDRLWPICRSITGNGLRESFAILQEIIPLNLTEVPSGTKVFDWEIPEEWNITDAYIICPDGKKICDFKVNNLHVVNYSVPVNKEITYDELLPHLHYMLQLPDAIPYIASYYKPVWGFCISFNEFTALSKTGTYKVVIDSSLKKGNLTYGDLLLKGETDEEILFSTYLCHPSMANNELSGPLVAAFLYSKIAALKHRKYSYRFIIAPETIGIIAYLSRYGEHLLKNLKAGYVLTCCGDDAPFVYKRSKKSNSLADRVAEHVLKYSGNKYELMNFSVGGSDERQYCSPGFNLPVGSMTRSMYQRYKEYHTSLDNKSFISFAAMKQTTEVYFEFVKALELNDVFKNKIQFCEPQLGKRGLYPSSADPMANRENTHNLMHFLTYADGKSDLIDIAEKVNKPLFRFEEIVDKVMAAGLIEKGAAL